MNKYQRIKCINCNNFVCVRNPMIGAGERVFCLQCERQKNVRQVIAIATTRFEGLYPELLALLCEYLTVHPDVAIMIYNEIVNS